MVSTEQVYGDHIVAHVSYQASAWTSPGTQSIKKELVPQETASKKDLYLPTRMLSFLRNCP